MELDFFFCRGHFWSSRLGFLSLFLLLEVVFLHLRAGRAAVQTIDLRRLWRMTVHDDQSSKRYFLALVSKGGYICSRSWFGIFGTIFALVHLAVLNKVVLRLFTVRYLARRTRLSLWHLCRSPTRRGIVFQSVNFIMIMMIRKRYVWWMMMITTPMN